MPLNKFMETHGGGGASADAISKDVSNTSFWGTIGEL